MSAPNPRVRIEGGVLIVDLVPAPAAHRIAFEGVVDQTSFGDVVGIEILDFRGQLNAGSPPTSLNDDLPRWSYDDEIDAFYLRLAAGTAEVQRPTVGTAVFDDANRLIGLEVASGP